MNSKEMYAKAQVLFNEAKSLQAALGDSPSKVQLDAVDAKLGECDSWKAQADTARRIEGGDESFSDPARPPVSWRQAGPNEGNAPVDSKSWREVKVAHPTKRDFSVRYNVPEAVARVEKDYSPAFESYLRKGLDGVGPNDRKTLSEGIDTAGGFLVPPDYQATLIKKIAITAIMRQYGRVIQSSRDLVQFPRVNYATDDKWTSPVRVTWAGEVPPLATTTRVTDPVYGLLQVRVDTAMATWPMSNNLIEDAAFDIVGDSQDLIGEAFGLGEDYAFWVGTGVAQPLGAFDTKNNVTVVNSGTSASITTSSDAWSGKRLLDVYYGTPIQYRKLPTSIWVMNSGTLEAAENLVDGQKRPLIKELTGASLEMGEADAIKGKVIGVSEFAPDIGASTYPILFGDCKGYLIVDRVGLSIQRNAYLYQETNITLLVAKARVGGLMIEPYRFRMMQAS